MFSRTKKDSFYSSYSEKTQNLRSTCSLVLEITFGNCDFCKDYRVRINIPHIPNTFCELVAIFILLKKIFLIQVLIHFSISKVERSFFGSRNGS